MGTAQASDYLENKTVDHWFRTAVFLKPAGLWVALYTAAPTDAGGGTEVAGGGYARVALPPTDANWKGTHGTTSGPSSGTSGSVSNAVPITFPAPTAIWGTVVAVGVLDAATAGNLLIWDTLATPRPIIANDPAPSFAVDALTISLS